MKANPNNGLTLVEIVLYAALCTILLGAIFNAALLLSNSYKEIKMTKSTQMSGLSAMDRMTRTIREAISIDGTQTVYNNANGSLMLRSLDSYGDTHTTRFYLSGGRVVIDEDGATLGPLTEASVAVTSLVFRPIDTGNSVGVKIEMTVGNENFYNTVMLRGSYQ